MKRYVRFQLDGKIRYGLLNEQMIELLEGNSIAEFITTGKFIDKDNIQLMIPCTPEKIICSGLNYYDTVLEDGASLPKKPLLFLKPPSAIVLSGENIIKTKMVNTLTCEAELGVVISKKAKDVSIEDAKDYIWGFIMANDVTAKDLQKEDVQWTRAKSFDTFLPLGSEIISGIDHKDLRIRALINGVTKQDGNTKDMIFDIDYLISYASQIMTLNEGDIIITGTPGGYGKIIVDGDSVSIEIQGLGSIINTVKEVN